MDDDQVSASDEPETPGTLTFDLVCCECGKDIRLSREIESGGMTVAMYADELGLENTDFHFHVPH